MGAASSGIGTTLGGVLTTVVGGITLQPELVALGAATIVGGAVQGAVGAATAQKAKNENRQITRDEAARVATIDALASKASAFHANVLADAKKGSYGSAAAKTVDAFAASVATGRTLSGAFAEAGVLPAWGASQHQTLSRAANKYMGITSNGGVMNPSTARHFGDPVYGRAGMQLRGSGRPGTRKAFNIMANDHILDVLSASTQPTPQYPSMISGGGGGGRPFGQPSAPAGVGSAVGQGGQSMGGGVYSSSFGPGSQSYQGRIAQGSITANRGGTFSAVSAS